MPAYKEMRRACLNPCAVHYWSVFGPTFKYESCIAKCVEKKKDNHQISHSSNKNKLK